MQSDKIPTQNYFIIALLGCWLIASTITFGIYDQWLVYTNFLAGALLIFLGLKSRKEGRSWQIWSIAAIGIWLQISPLLFWAHNPASYVNDTFIGVSIIALSITLHPMPGLTFQDEPSIPPGWSYNPSSWSQRLPIAFLAFICWMISRYLAAYQLGYIHLVWDPFFDPGTQAVLESDVSKAFPVSDAGLGAFAYTLEFFSACQGSTTRWRTAPWLVLIFGILVIPVSLVSTILIILQPLAVGTWCSLCLITAIAMLLGIPLAIGEVAASLQFLKRSKQKPFLKLLFQGGVCPNEIPDRKSPSMDSSLLTILKSSLSGITFPLNLIASSLLGIALMTLPSFFSLERGGIYTIDPIIGALTTVFSVIAFAEYARSIRWINLLFALLLLIGSFLFKMELSPPAFLVHIAFSLILALCSIRKGPIRERFNLHLEL